MARARLAFFVPAEGHSTMLCCSICREMLHNSLHMLVVAGRHLCTLLDHYYNHYLTSSVVHVPNHNHFIYKGMAAT